MDIGALVSPGNFRPSTTTFVVKVLTGSAPAAVTVNGRALPLLADDKIAGGTDAGWWHTGERRGTTCVRIPAEAAALALKLPSPLDDAALYRAAYAEEVRLARQMLAAAGGAGGQQAAADLIGSALVESERLAAVPAKCDQALAALDSALSQAQALVAAAQPQRRALAATDSGYIGNGANADLNFSTKKELWVMRDTTAPDGEYKSFVRFDLTKLAETPKKAMLSLTCKDAGKPLPGHLEIHCMLHACSQPPDLKTVTWRSYEAMAPKLEPVVDFFPAKGKAQMLDVTAAVSQALKDGRTEIVFVVDSIDETGQPALRFSSSRAFDNKPTLPVLLVE